MPKPAVQRHEVARVAVQRGRNHKRSEKIRRCRRSHRSAETFSVSSHSLAIGGQRILRLPDSRARRGTEKTRRSDALIREKFEFLFHAQRAGAGGDIGKENRAPFQNFDGRLDTILPRSEERRVGKEGRCRWTPEDEKKKK